MPSWPVDEVAGVGLQQVDVAGDRFGADDFVGDRVVRGRAAARSPMAVPIFEESGQVTGLVVS